MAKRCNCDAVKFQKRDIDIVYSKDELKSLREVLGNTFRQQKEGLEFNKKEYDEINSYCKKTKYNMVCFCWDLNSLAFLDNYSLKFNKIASAMITNVEFLNEVSQRESILLFLQECQIYQIFKQLLIFLKKINVHLKLCTRSQPIHVPKSY